VIFAEVLGTVVAMSLREHIGVQLGFIAMTGAISLVLVLALLGNRVKEASSFEECVQELDWRAIFFYIALFALVGGLEKMNILELLAHSLTPIFQESLALGATKWQTIRYAVLPHALPDTALVDALNQSAYWHQQGNSTKALAYAQEAQNIQSNSVDAWFALGNARLLKNNYAKNLTSGKTKWW